MEKQLEFAFMDEIKVKPEIQLRFPFEEFEDRELLSNSQKQFSLKGLFHLTNAIATGFIVTQLNYGLGSYLFDLKEDPIKDPITKGLCSVIGVSVGAALYYIEKDVFNSYIMARRLARDPWAY